MEQSGPFRFAYSYFRSGEARHYQLEGQDALAFVAGHDVFSFCLCDGVGQSFNGELAAQALASTVSEFLYSNWPTPGSIDECLREAAWLGRRAVERFQFNADTTDLLRQVLEQKRVIGSETTLIAGRIAVLEDGEVQYTFASLGDSRIAWQADGQPMVRLVPDSKQRWSTHRGVLGSEQLIFTAQGSARRLKVRAYSDGLAVLDDEMSDFGSILPPERFRGVSESPDSDDISWLEVEVDVQAEREG